MPEELSKTVWSYGGGTQSAAIAVLILQEKLPRPDIVVMADTSREVSETWEYLERNVRPAGLDVKIVGHEYSHWDIVKSKQNNILLPAFTRKNGRIGKLPTFCSDEWKQRPIRRWLRENKYNNCDVWIGISTDEAHRMKYSGLNWYRHVYPLIEMMQVSRNRCLQIVEDFGWPRPPKSRCYMCPNMSGEDWKNLRSRYPDDFSKAIDLEDKLREIDQDIYLHRLAIPLADAVDQAQLQQSFDFDGCDSGYCWT